MGVRVVDTSAHNNTVSVTYSWDRQPIVHEDTEGKTAINPAMHHLVRNFIFNRNWLGDTRSGYSIDYDDGSR